MKISVDTLPALIWVKGTSCRDVGVFSDGEDTHEVSGEHFEVMIMFWE